MTLLRRSQVYQRKRDAVIIQMMDLLSHVIQGTLMSRLRPMLSRDPGCSRLLLRNSLLLNAWRRRNSKLWYDLKLMYANRENGGERERVRERERERGRKRERERERVGKRIWYPTTLVL